MRAPPRGCGAWRSLRLRDAGGADVSRRRFPVQLSRMGLRRRAARTSAHALDGALRRQSARSDAERRSAGVAGVGRVRLRRLVQSGLAGRRLPVQSRNIAGNRNDCLAAGDTKRVVITVVSCVGKRIFDCSDSGYLADGETIELQADQSDEHEQNANDPGIWPGA
jgi:hypothetical protein